MREANALQSICWANLGRAPSRAPETVRISQVRRGESQSNRSKSWRENRDNAIRPNVVGFFPHPQHSNSSLWGLFDTLAAAY